MLRSASQAIVRRARVEDAADLADVFKQAWLLAYTGMLPDEHLARMIAQRTPIWWSKAIANHDRILVLEVESSVVGYATYGPLRFRRSRGGEIYEIYLTPIYQGLGFGEVLFEGCRHELDQMQLPGLIVWALADNEQAQHFYWRRGGRPIAEAGERFGSRSLTKVAYRWP
jgi:ribosomal protein S18 acetylase RimI-like enzyme